MPNIIKKTCVICNKYAKFRFSPDLDISGLGACNKHLEDVRIIYSLLLSGNEDLAYKLINSAKKANKSKSKSPTKLNSLTQG
jgi:hypothetical protein